MGNRSLYYLNCLTERQQADAADNQSQQAKEDAWHRPYGVQNLQTWAKEELVDGFDFNSPQTINFCEPCMEGKQQRRKFPDRKGSDGPLDLVHSDVCGTMNAKPLSGGAYFQTFADDKTRCVWIYILKHKDEVFPWFLEWKPLVELSLKQKATTLLIDNGGGFESVRTVNALAVQNGLKWHLMDVATSFLYGELKKECT